MATAEMEIEVKTNLLGEVYVVQHKETMLILGTFGTKESAKAFTEGSSTLHILQLTVMP